MTSLGHAHLVRQHLWRVVTREPSSTIAENLGEISCTECTGQGNDCELISMVIMETSHPIEGSFGNEFLSSIIIVELW